MATIMAIRNNRQISWISEPMLPALSSTRAKSRPRKSSATRRSAKTGADASPAARLTASSRSRVSINTAMKWKVGR